MIIAQAPLRISFFGGGTDLPDYYRREGGAVLSAAIDKYVYAIVKERFDDAVYVNYSKKEIVESVDQVQHGLVRESMRISGVTRGVELTTLADVPSEGSGLGSSSSITVALLMALHGYNGVAVTARQLAEEACKIELDILKKPIGKQDQYAAAFGNLNTIRFRPDGGVNVEPLSLDPSSKRRLGERLMAFYTNQTRSADTILKEQTSRTSDNLETLRSMVAQVDTGSRLLLKGDLDGFGNLLHEAWEKKRRLAQGITNPTIDSMYQNARAAGAIGGKVAGAGGGGFLLLVVPPESQDRVRKALHGFRELPLTLARDGAKIVFNAHS